MAQPPTGPQQGYAPPQPQAGQPAWGQPGYGGYAPKPKEPWATRSRIAASLLLGGAALAILGAFLPWGSLNAGEAFPGVSLGSFNGFEGTDGWLAVATAVVLLVLGVLSFVRATRIGVTGIGITVIVLGILSGLWLAFIGIANMGGPNAGFGAVDLGFDFSPGAGLFVMILAGLVTLAGAGFMIASQTAAPKRGQGPTEQAQGYGSQGAYQPPPGQVQPGYQQPGYGREPQGQPPGYGPTPGQPPGYGPPPGGQNPPPGS